MGVVKDGKIILRDDVIETRQDGDIVASIGAFMREIRRPNAEWKHGAGQSVPNVVCVTLGMGLAG